MTPEQAQVIRVKLAQAKDQSEMALAAVAMLERNLRELCKQLHQVHTQMQGEK